ncbi:MAG TPA: hypothetical protein VMR86_18560 [Myxococcota bacterium]|nr:hypothetical protein [Myxococcota bacterium]
MTPSPSPSPTTSDWRLAPHWQAALILAFGAATAGFVLLFGGEARPLVDVLLMSASLGALVTSGLWLWLLAARRSRNWGIAFAVTLWVPYVNFVVASIFARRYWHEGARAPALLALAAMAGQTLATLRMFAPDLTVPV